jgi:hypothetical protein
MQHGVNLLAHIRAINECLPAIGGRAELNLETLRLQIKARGKRVELDPQFIFIHQNALAFTPQWLPQTTDFSGWRAYFNRVWPLAIEKLKFKAFCQAQSIRTPHMWARPQDVTTNALLKRSRSSFSMGMSGPLTPAMIGAARYSLNEGDFFEQFISGLIAKVWYWNELPVCLDVLSMPNVVGDGVLQLRQLIDRIRLPPIPPEWSMWEAVARFQGVTLESVIPAGQKVLVDFRYLSAANPFVLMNRNVIGKYAGSALLAELGQVGRLFWQGIPENCRDNVIYSIDGIIDDEQRMWYLEMNCNPIVHPDLYAPMLSSLLAATQPNA